LNEEGKMKKVAAILLAVFVLVSFSTVFAAEAEKTAKGQIEIGGMLSAYMWSESYSGDDEFYTEYKGTDVMLYPSVGYFVIPKLEIEPKLLVNFSSYKPKKDGKTSSMTNLGGILNVAYHFEGAMDSKVIPFVFAGVGILSNSAKDYGETVKDLKTTLIAPDAGVGIKYFITERGTIRVEGYIQRLDKAEGIDKLVETDFGLRGGITLFLK
jgi:hypothetical protein